MDSKKAMLIVIGLLAMVLLISSEVSARDLTETSTDTKKEVVKQTNGLNDALPIKLPPFKPKPIKIRPPHGNGCGQNDCCGQKYFGHCTKCCSYAGEAVDVQVEANTHN